MATTVAELTAVLKMNNANFKKGLSGAQKAISGLKKQINVISGAIIGAFAVDRISRFIVEAVKLAGQVEGVRAAFDKLNQANLLDDLRKATRGTVDDLTLMQYAVRAKNFQIPLEQLATFFEFATNRAIQTGESVDYLVRSIVDGIGRKSTLVLDNLGISASELQEEVKKVGDFGQAAANIISRGLAKAGDVADTTATKIGKLQAEFKNIKADMGQAFLVGGMGALNFLGELTNINLALEKLSRLTINLFVPEKLTEQQQELEGLLQIMRDAEVQVKKLTEKTGTLKPEPEDIEKAREAWEELNKTLREHREAQEETIFLNAKLTNSFIELARAIEEVPVFPKPRTVPGLWDILDKPEKDEPVPLTPMDRAADAMADANDETVEWNSNIAILAQSFTSLGDSIGRAMAGAEGSIESLGQSILSNIGNLMMMFGLQTGNLPLFLAGAAFQLGSGIWSGMGGVPSNTSSGVAGGQANVYFQISGQNLVGVLDRNNSKRNLVT